MKGHTADYLREQIILLQSVVSKQAGVPLPALIDKQTVWAQYKPLTSSESFSDDRELVQADCEFIIRYSSEVAWLKAKDGIKFDGKVYDLIAAPVEIARREFLSLKAKLRDANG